MVVGWAAAIAGVSGRFIESFGRAGGGGVVNRDAGEVGGAGLVCGGVGDRVWGDRSVGAGGLAGSSGETFGGVGGAV